MDKKISYVFFGSPRFAKIILAKLIQNGIPPQAVVCNPDRPVGRKKILTAPPVKDLILNQNLFSGVKILQPEKLDSDLVEADFFVVAAYAKIIPKALLDQAKLGTIGVHPSLLPKHRGASPIQTAILENDPVTGVSLYMMDEKMDNGPIITQKEIPVAENDSYLTLEEKLANLAADLLIETLPKLIINEIKLKDQDHTQATFTKKFKTEDGFISEKDLTEAISGNLVLSKIIDAKIRALGVEPGAWTLKNGKRIKLLESEITNGKLTLKKIQIEGKKEQVFSGF